MSLWRSPEFVKLWVGQTISEIGTRVSREGIPLTAVLVLHASPAQMGWLTAIGGLAALVAGPLAGTVADRNRRKPLMITADLGRALVLASIPWAYFRGSLGMGHLFGVAALSGMLAVLFDVAYPTFVPTLVEPEELLEANSKLALTMSVAEVTGPALTGLLVRLISAPVAILLDAASFIVSALSIAWIARPEPAPAPPDEVRSWWREATSGIAFVFAHPLLRPLALRTATVSLAWGFFATLYVYYAIEVLKGSLAGVFNACSTLFTIDLYQKWRPKASEHQLVRTGRLATVVMVLIAFLWIPVIKNAAGVYGYLQGVQSYLAPPIFVVFFLGVFVKRMNAAGSLWAMVVGFALGIFRMIVDTPVTLGLAGFEKGYASGSFLWIVNNIYFQYFSVLITIVSAIVMVGVSYMTAEPDYSLIRGLTFETTSDADRARSRSSWSGKEVAASGLVLACILGSYLYFQG